jgi:hypothetical protein
MGAFVEGVLHLHFQHNLYLSPFIVFHPFLRCFQVEAKAGFCWIMFVIDANGLITWEIVGSYVIDVNGLV